MIKIITVVEAWENKSLDKLRGVRQTFSLIKFRDVDNWYYISRLLYILHLVQRAVKVSLIASFSPMQLLLSCQVPALVEYKCTCPLLCTYEYVGLKIISSTLLSREPKGYCTTDQQMPVLKSIARGFCPFKGYINHIITKAHIHSTENHSVLLFVNIAIK